MIGNARPPVPRLPVPKRAPDVPEVIRWDGKVPAEHRGAFAHKIITEFGQPLAARWSIDQISPDGGYWWIEGRQTVLYPRQVSTNGWAYGGPLLDEPHRELNARVEREAHQLFLAVQALKESPLVRRLIQLRRTPEFGALLDTWMNTKRAKDARVIAGHPASAEIEETSGNVR
ncbi:hypothetical protein [Roseomonas indoligenes]|uniref:Uncharacterized protein n=1 Tax=Roseomonas indoligenes TaxID=2820811 RepID=A0A940MW77_9PROT|nr:hypothetical protein [Pararoseomonas indoligenes]MBP0492120.1 hypothetical protein [Pararoseomonas indoligenes]